MNAADAIKEASTMSPIVTIFGAIRTVITGSDDLLAPEPGPEQYEVIDAAIAAIGQALDLADYEDAGDLTPDVLTQDVVAKAISIL